MPLVSGDPIHTKGDAKMSLPEAPGNDCCDLAGPCVRILGELDVLDERLDAWRAVGRTSCRPDQAECGVERFGTPIGLVGVSVRQRLPEASNTHDVGACGGEPEKARAVPSGRPGRRCG